MPTTAKKGLYIGKSLAELNQKAGQMEKVKDGQCRMFLKSSDKVLEKAEEAELLGDEERAYVLFMKCCNIFQGIMKTPEYKKSKNYFDSMWKEKFMKAIKAAEKLSESLKIRYDELEAETVAKKLNNLDSQAEHLNGLVDPPTDLPTENSEDKPSEPVKEPEASKEAEKVMSSERLYSLIQDPSVSLLIMDARTTVDFEASHIADSHCISVPQEYISPGCTSNHIEAKLSERSREMWDRRHQVDFVILLDWNSSEQSLALRTTISSLKDAIFKWDQDKVLKSEPLILDGGYRDWLYLYPAYSTDPHVRAPPLQDASSKNQLPSLDQISYEDAWNILKPPPPPQPEHTAPDLTYYSATEDNSASIQNNVVQPRLPDRSFKPQASYYNNLANNNPKNSNESTDREKVVIKTIHNDLSKRNKLNNSSSSASTTNSERSSELSSDDNVPEQSQPEKKSNLEPKKTTPVTPHVPDRTLKPVNQAASRADTARRESEEAARRQESEEATRRQESEEAARRQESEEAARQEEERKQQEIQQEERDLDRLRALKAKEAKEAAELMREKRKITEELEKLREEQAVARQKSEERTLSKDEEKDLVTASLPETKSKPTFNREDKKLVEDLEKKQKEIEEQERAMQEEIKRKQREIEEKEKQRMKAEEERRLALERKQAEEAKLKAEEAKLKAEEAKSKAEETKRRAEEAQKRQEVELERKTREEEERKRRAAEQARLRARDEEARKQQSIMDTSKTALPVGWEKKLDPVSKKYYYIDHKNKKTHWQLPSQSSTSSSVSSSNAVYQAKLKDEPETSGGGGLKRSHSSPNVAKIMQDAEERKSLPAVNRDTKPKPVQNLPSPTTSLTSAKVRNFHPTWGSVSSGLSGLRNQGNTCYMNSTLQCLSNTTILNKYFLENMFVDDINRTNTMGSGGRIAEELALLIKAIWCGQYKAITPRDFRMAAATESSQFGTYVQQDSHDFLACLLDWLHEDLNKVQSRRPLPEQNNDNLDDDTAARRAWELHRSINDSIIVSLFQGQFKSTVTCNTCDKKSVTFDTFMYLLLEVPSSSKCSLRDCILNFSKEEKMTGDCKWNCPKCKRKQVATKRIVIWKLPTICIIMLKRFHQSGMWHTKNSAHVEFPLEDFDMSRYASGPNPRRPYKLYGMSLHHGASMETGHYTAICWNYFKKSWYNFDDSDVSEVSRSEVTKKTQSAYILFYTSLTAKG